MSCEETREHLEACEECRLHVAVEARLVAQPVVDPPRGLAARVMRSLPRRVPVAREFLRLAAAAAILLGLASGVFALGLDRHEKVGASVTEARRLILAAAANLNLLGSER